MALISPGVENTEIDLTSTINNAATGRAALVGQFSWGPSDVIKQITSEADLLKVYGAPTDENFASFFSAANFLSYGNDLRILRAIRSDAAIATLTGGSGLVAKYTGLFGNRISITSWDSAEAFSLYSQYLQFKATTNQAAIVVRLDGVVVEAHLVSNVATDKDIYNNSLYVTDVLERSSTYITTTGTPTVATAADTFMAGGSDGSADIASSYVTAWDAFEDRYELYVNLFIAGDAAEVGDSVVTKIKDIMELRQDAIAFLSPKKVDVVDAADVSTAVTNITTYKNTTLNITSTYVAFDGNYKYQYDKYNDKFRWLPLNADIAGLCVYTDDVAAPWFSPAGINRGQIRGVTKLALSTNQSYRDTLYESGVNPVVAFSGQGFFLYGDKTAAVGATAFDRINVRRLFNALKKAISDSSQFKLFELNDNFTRVSFKAEIDQYLQSIKAQRGILDFYTVIDDTNNTALVIDTNQFIADIYIKPARSINFIQLNFVATGSAVDFDELLTR